MDYKNYIDNLVTALKAISKELHEQNRIARAEYELHCSYAAMIKNVIDDIYINDKSEDDLK